jgi:hypothetical protein
VKEHDFEPIRGLPGDLPEGESVLWQGAPNWLTLAEQAFHLRAVAAYFGLMLAWRTALAVAHGEPAAKAFLSAATVAPIAFAALGILAFLAWLNSRTTVYTITNKRVVMRFGAAVPKAINIPFTIIESAALKPLGKTAGDLALGLKAPNKIAFLHLWPHARPWRLKAPHPTLRALPDAGAAAKILASAMEARGVIERTRAERPEQARFPGVGQTPSPAIGQPEAVAA